MYNPIREIAQPCNDHDKYCSFHEFRTKQMFTIDPTLIFYIVEFLRTNIIIYIFSCYNISKRYTRNLVGYNLSVKN